MAWYIDCRDTGCGNTTTARNIVDLIDNHRDSEGWFLCERCGRKGHIEKEYQLQEGGNPWSPYLRGVIEPPGYDATYRPFAFLTSEECDASISGIWFCYYKDLRSRGGKLKMGHGPGGPPVFGLDDMRNLWAQMMELTLIAD